MKKSILAVTGTRADYGIYRPVFQAITRSDVLDLSLVVIGMHLRSEFGRTVDTIRADGFRVAAEIDTLTTEDTLRAMAEYVGRTTVECAKVFAEQKPNILFLLGDRGEQLAAATAALYMRIPIAHLHGGEQSGSVDDPVRHAITHLAAIHMTTADVHAENIRRMLGKIPSPVWRGLAIRPRAHGRGGGGAVDDVFVVGSPALDVIRTLDAIPKNILFRDTGFNPMLPIALFVQHPDTTEGLSPEEQLRPSLDALASFSGNIFLVGTNADAGGLQMNAMLQRFASSGRCRHFYITVPHREFLSLEACADVLIGNSSSGIIEAASFKLPVVNIGNRQKGRLRSGNVIDVPYDATAISAGITRAMSSDFRTQVQQCRNVYGDGHAAERIVEVLENYSGVISTWMR